MNKRLVLMLTALAVASVSALADDKTPSQPVDQQKLQDERAKAKEAKKTHPLPLKGGFGPAGGREEAKTMRDGAEQRNQLQREQSEKAWALKYGPEDPASKPAAR
jgi:hypothetical protein